MRIATRARCQVQKSRESFTVRVSSFPTKTLEVIRCPPTKGVCMNYRNAFDMTGSVAVITGGARGIGFEIQSPK